MGKRRGKLGATVSGNQVGVAEKEKYLEEVRRQGNAEEIRKAEEALKEAKDKLALAEKDYEKYQSNPKTQPDFEGEDSAKKALGK